MQRVAILGCPRCCQYDDLQKREAEVHQGPKSSRIELHGFMVGFTVRVLAKYLITLAVGFSSVVHESERLVSSFTVSPVQSWRPGVLLSFVPLGQVE